MWALHGLTSSEIATLDTLLSKMEKRLAQSAEPTAQVLEEVYAAVSERARAAYLFADRAHAYDASKP
jgi:hypothetical protein